MGTALWRVLSISSPFAAWTFRSSEESWWTASVFLIELRRWFRSRFSDATGRGLRSYASALPWTRSLILIILGKYAQRVSDLVNASEFFPKNVWTPSRRKDWKIPLAHRLLSKVYIFSSPFFSDFNCRISWEKQTNKHPNQQTNNGTVSSGSRRSILWGIQYPWKRSIRSY